MGSLKINGRSFDFVDFGSSKGAAIDFGKKHLAGKSGIGVDIDPERVRKMQSAGYDCIQGDITRLDLPRKSVRFVIMSHILEHLNDLSEVRDAVRCASDLATDFLFILGPFFDRDPELRKLGLKPYWSHWSVHKCHLTCPQLRNILEELELTDHMFLAREPIEDSNHPAIHPLSSPKNQVEYDPATHPPKPSVRFKGPMYSEFICIVALQPLTYWNKLISARSDCRPYLLTAGT